MLTADPRNVTNLASATDSAPHELEDTGHHGVIDGQDSEMRRRLIVPAEKAADLRQVVALVGNQGSVLYHQKCGIERNADNEPEDDFLILSPEIGHSCFHGLVLGGGGNIAQTKFMSRRGSNGFRYRS